MEALDEDEGIRLIGGLKDFSHGGFLFVTKSVKGYCVNLVDRVWDEKKRRYNVGGRDRWVYRTDFQKAWEFVRARVKRPVEGWLY